MAEHKASHAPRRSDDAKRRAFRWRPREIAALLKAALKEFMEDKSPKQAAALAYYTLFALGPLLLLAISIAALVVGQDAARNAISGQLAGFLGSTGGEAVDTLLEGADRRRAGIVGALVGGALLLFAAGGVFGQLKEALNRVWEVEAKKPEGFLRKVAQAFRKNFLSFVGVIGTGFLLLVSLVASAFLAAAGRYFESILPGSALVWQVLNFVVSFAFVALVFGLMFKFLPDARISWKDVLVGALVTAILFVAGQFALGYYLGAGPVADRFGAAGAIVVVLVWVYYSGMIVFFGAELTQVYANVYGSRVRPSRDAESYPDAVQERQSDPQEEGIHERRTPRGTTRQGRGEGGAS